MKMFNKHHSIARGRYLSGFGCPSTSVRLQTLGHFEYKASPGCRLRFAVPAPTNSIPQFQERYKLLCIQTHHPSWLFM